MRYDTQISRPVCEECELNAATTLGCNRCNVTYCYHFASEVAPDIYCGNCMADFHAEKTIATKESLKTGTVGATRARSCLHYEFSGSDLHFEEKKINECSDEELAQKAAYHLYMESLCLNVQRDRQMKVQMAQQQKPSTKQQNTSANAATIPQPKTKTARVKKVKMLSRQEAIDAFVQMFNKTPSEQELQFVMGIKKVGEKDEES